MMVDPMTAEDSKLNDDVHEDTDEKFTEDADAASDVKEDGAEPPASSSAARMVLIVALGVLAAVVGFYSTVRTPEPDATAELDPIVPGFVPAGSGIPAATPPPQAGPVANPLDFLNENLLERPSEVPKLIEEVKKVAETLVEGFPHETDAYEVAGRLYFRLGDAEAAAKSWEKSLELNPDFAYAYHGLGRLAAKEGKHAEAASLFRRALALSPTSHETQIDLAMALIDASEAEEAIGVLETNVASDPRPYRGLVLMGMAHRQLGQFDKARVAYEAAIESHPTHANAHAGLATTYAHLKEGELAKEFMAKYRELMEGERELAVDERLEFDDLETMCVDVAGTYFEAATICYSRGHPFEAEVLLRRAGVLNPANVECRQSLAFLYLQLNQLAETANVLRELSEIQADNPVYPVELARILISLGKPIEAEQTLRQAASNFSVEEVLQIADAASKQPDQNSTHFVVVSMVHELNEDLPAAAESMGKAVEMSPDSTELTKRHEALLERAK